MARNSHYLVSFEDVHATVGGYSIDSIVELHLSATANDIPTVTLLVDTKSSTAGMGQVADAMSLGEAREVFDTCRSMVKTSGGTLSLNVKVRAVGQDGADEQTLSISGWILTDVSFSPVQLSGVATVSLTFQHPLCKADFGGIVPGLLSQAPNWRGLNGSNPLDLYISALQIYGIEVRRANPRPASVAGASNTLEVRENMLRRLSQAASALSGGLSWTGGGLPAEHLVASWGTALRQGLAVYAMPYGGTSVFQRFARGLVPECSLAIGGDYTGAKLDVGPFRPWADASLSINEGDIFSISFPQRDPSPISGVKVCSSDTADALGFSYHLDSYQAGTRPADVFYVPKSELAAEFLYGPIVQFQSPSWLEDARAFMTTMSDRGRADGTSAKSGRLHLRTTVARGGSAPATGSGGRSGPPVDYSRAMLACAKTFYETSLMKDWTFNVNTRLLINKGGVLCPGKVLSVNSASGEALAGYVINVTHSISVPSKAAHTSITCAYPRFGSLPRGITSGANALYS